MSALAERGQACGLVNRSATRCRGSSCTVTVTIPASCGTPPTPPSKSVADRVLMLCVLQGWRLLDEGLEASWRAAEKVADGAGEPVVPVVFVEPGHCRDVVLYVGGRPRGLRSCSSQFR